MKQKIKKYQWRWLVRLTFMYYEKKYYVQILNSYNFFLSVLHYNKMLKKVNTNQNIYTKKEFKLFFIIIPINKYILVLHSPCNPPRRLQSNYRVTQEVGKTNCKSDSRYSIIQQSII